MDASCCVLGAEPGPSGPSLFLIGRHEYLKFRAVDFLGFNYCHPLGTLRCLLLLDLGIIFAFNTLLRTLRPQVLARSWAFRSRPESLPGETSASRNRASLSACVLLPSSNGLKLVHLLSYLRSVPKTERLCGSGFRPCLPRQSAPRHAGSSSYNF